MERCVEWRMIRGALHRMRSQWQSLLLVPKTGACMTAVHANDVSTADEPVFLARLRAHFRSDPALLPVVEQDFAIYERPNLHLTVEEALAEPGRQSDLIGVL